MLLQRVPKDVIRRINSMHINDIIASQGINILWVRFVCSDDEEVEIFMGEHQHTFCEVHMCLDGELIYDVGESSVSVKKGEGIAIGPNTVHAYQGNAAYKKCVLAFSADPESEFYGELQKICMSKFYCQPGIMNSFCGLLETMESDDCFTSKLAAGYAFQMVYHTLKSINFRLPEESRQNNSADDPRLIVAKKYIQDNQRKKLSCEDVARECGLSVKQLGRIFKKYTDQSLAEYIKDCKLKACEELLLDNRYTVKEIGYILGFENEYYFNSFFKRHYGMPPGLFKKQNAVTKQED